MSHVLARQGDVDVATFKRRVRRLKELGLTESLEVGSASRQGGVQCSRTLGNL